VVESQRTLRWSRQARPAVVRSQPRLGGRSNPETGWTCRWHPRCETSDATADTWTRLPGVQHL